MTTSPYLFADLAVAELQSTIRARLMAALLADGQPTASWVPSEAGGIENLRADMVAGGLAAYSAQRIASFVTGRILPLATDSAENGYFLTYLGLKFYKLAKRRPTYTIQNIALTAAPTASSNTFSDGDLWVKSPSTGNRYRLTLAPDETITLQPGATVNAPFQAENPGSSYLDPAGTVNFMVTAKAGVTCTNMRPYDFAPTRSTGSPSGTIDGTFTALVAPAYSVLRIRIDVSGDVGTGFFSWSIDGGVTWTRVVTPIPATWLVPVPNGGTVFFHDGNSPGFPAGSIFTLRVGDAILQRGTDGETDEAFRARCSNRHPARSLIPLKAHIELWAHSASPEVAKVASDADRNTPGGILVTVASETGPASPAAQLAVEDYILQRLQGYKNVPAPVAPTVAGSTSPEETVMVSSAVKFQVTASATVYVPRLLMAAAQAGADQAWNLYLASLPLGGQRYSLVELIRFETILGDLGAQDIQGLQLNGYSSDLAVPTGQVAVPADGWTLLAGLTWVAV